MGRFTPALVLKRVFLSHSRFVFLVPSGCSLVQTRSRYTSRRRVGQGFSIRGRWLSYATRDLDHPHHAPNLQPLFDTHALFCAMLYINAAVNRVFRLLCFSCHYCAFDLFTKRLPFSLPSSPASALPSTTLERRSSRPHYRHSATHSFRKIHSCSFFFCLLPFHLLIPHFHFYYISFNNHDYSRL